MEGNRGKRKREIWREEKNCFLDSKMGEKEFEGERIERILWIFYMKVSICPKLKRFEGI